MRLLRKCLVLSVFVSFRLLVNSNISFGQESQNNKRPLVYYMDVLSFPKLGQPSLTKTEVILGLELNQLNFEKKEDKYYAFFELKVNLFDSTNQPIEGKIWSQSITHPIQDFNLRSKAILLQKDFLVKPGEYLVKSSLADSISGRKANLRRRIVVKDFSAEEVKISDIEFASKIAPQKSESPFNKYGITVLPKPNRVFRYNEKLLFYCEFINLRYDQESSLEYTVKYRIQDQDGKTIIEKGPVRKKKMGTSSTEASAISIDDLKEGNYQLEIIIADIATDQSDNTRAFFTVLRNEANKKMLFTDDMAETFYHMVIYLMTDYERNLYNQLNLNGKKQFMINFWKKKDLNPDTPKNEYKEEIYGRWRYVRSNYGGIEKGWRSDRGRIFMKYGMPTLTERYPHEFDRKAHEIWKYDRGNMEFIFVDLRSTGDYTLVSGWTPDQSEVYDPDWEKWLK